MTFVKFRRCCFLAPMIALSSITIPAHAEVSPGENLLQSLPLPQDGWSTYARKDENDTIRIWARNRKNDQLITAKSLGRSKKDLLGVKRQDANLGIENCEYFSTEREYRSVENGYDTLTWFTRCKTRPGMEIYVLHKALLGKDLFYHLKRIWKGTYDESQLDQWLKYFKTIKLCDTRSNATPCPSR